MEKELDNQVEFIICEPIDINEHPYWVEPMDCFDGMNITTFHTCSYYEILNALLNREETVKIDGYYFNLNWIVIKINGKEINKNEYISTI